MITPEQHAAIRRLYFGEHWKVGTDAAALGVHHDTVDGAELVPARTIVLRSRVLMLRVRQVGS